MIQDTHTDHYMPQAGPINNIVLYRRNLEMISHDGRDFLLGFQTNEWSIIILHSNHI